MGVMTSGRRRPLPEHREIDAEKLADAAQRVADLVVHPAGRQVDEPGGEVGEQRLELQTASPGGDSGRQGAPSA